MSDRMRSALSITVRVILYLCCVALAIYGCAHTGWLYLGLEFIGLAGIIAIIAYYNARNKYDVR